MSKFVSVSFKATKIIEPEDDTYVAQLAQMKKNEQLFYTLLQRFRPDLYVLADLIDQNSVNPLIIFKFIRQMVNIANGTQWGRVNLYIERGKAIRVEGVDSDTIGENVIVKKKRI